MHKWRLVLETIHLRAWRNANSGTTFQRCQVASTMKKSLLEAIKERPLLGDGAMGTQLMLAGLEQGGCGEAWNLTHPERVLAIQRRYAEAGSDCMLTNTFGGSRIMLNRHGQRATSSRSTRRPCESPARRSAAARLRASATSVRSAG